MSQSSSKAIVPRIRSVNDLFIFVCILLTIPLNFLVTFYAHGVVAGIESDSKQIEDGVSLFIEIPNSIVQMIVSPIIPLILIILLAISKRIIDIISTFISLILCVITILVTLAVVDAINLPILSLGYSTQATHALPSVPIYVAFVISTLFIYDTSRNLKYTKTLWWVCGICIILLMIFGAFTLMSGLMAVQIGALIGYLQRYIFGQVNNRVSMKFLIKYIRKQGFEVTNVRELNQWNTLRCRYLIADVDGVTLPTSEQNAISSVNSELVKHQLIPNNNALNADVKHLFLQIYDYDRGVFNFLEKLLQFIKYKNVRLRNTGKHYEYEHNALMNYLLFGAGLNQMRIISSTQFEGSAVFIYDNSGGIRHINANEPLTSSQLTLFWQQLNQAHAQNITFNGLSSDDLMLLFDKPAIINSTNADHGSNALFKRLDDACLLAALAVFAPIEHCARSLVDFVLSSRPAKQQSLILSEILASINSFNIPLTTRNKLRERYPDIDPLETLKDELSARLEGISDAKEQSNSVNIMTTDYRRLSLGKIVTFGLTVFAVMILLVQLDYQSLVDAVLESNFGWSFVALLASFITFLGGATALRGFGHKLKIRLRDAYIVQIAASWASVQLPAALGPITMNLRYLNKVNPGNHKVIAGNSAVVSLVQSAQAICSLTMLVIVATITGGRIDNMFEIGSVLIVVALCAVLICIIMAIAPLRAYFTKRITPLLSGFLESLRIILRNPKALLIGFIGCIMQELGYCLALYFSLLAFGVNLSFVTVIFVFLVANAAGSSVPTPGGLGVYETAITLALGVAGVTPGVALSATLLYRIITFWLRAPLGFVIQKVLEKKQIIS